MIGLALIPGDVQLARRQRAVEHDRAGVLADIDEAAHADDLVAKAAHIHVALGIDLREGQEGEIEPAAIVEIELRRLLDHGGEILAAAGIAAGDRRAADHALLVGQVHFLEQAFLRRHRRQPGRDAGTQIADGAGKQLHRGAAHDHFARSEGQRLDVLDRDAQLARIARVVIGRIGLPLLRIDDHEIDQDAGDLHLLARQRAAPRHALHLHDDDAAEAPRCLRHGQHLAQHRLLLHRDIAVFIGRGAAQKGDADRDGLEEQPFLAADRHHLNEIRRRARALPRPCWRGSTKVRRPVLESRPGRPPAMSRINCDSTPCGSV